MGFATLLRSCPGLGLFTLTENFIALQVWGRGVRCCSEEKENTQPSPDDTPYFLLYIAVIGACSRSVRARQNGMLRVLNSTVFVNHLRTRESTQKTTRMRLMGSRKTLKFRFRHTNPHS